MDIAEVKREARFKVESLMGLFDFLEEEIKEARAREGSIKEAQITLIGLLCSLRDDLRARGDFENADKIRDQFQRIGVKIEDQKVQPQAV